MSIIQRTLTAVVYNPANPAGTAKYLDVIEARVRADERSIPLYTMDVTIAAPGADVEAMLDPAANNTFVVGTTYAGSDPSAKNNRYWAALVAGTSRPDDGSLQITAVSHDTRLLEYSPTADDRSGITMQSDLRNVWLHVMDTVYGGRAAWTQVTYLGDGVLAPLTPFPTYRAVTNLCTNGGFEYGTTGWAGAYATIAASTTQKHSGTYSMSLVPNTSNQTASRAALVQNLQPGTTYTLSAWIRTSATMSTTITDARKVYVVGATAGTVSRLAETPAAPNVANQWNRVSVTFTTPSLMDAGTFELRVLNGTTTANSVTMWVDDIMLVEGDGTDTDGTLLSYFDGDTVDGTAGYNYDWQGSAGNSSSSRTPIIDRDPDVLTWPAGQSAYDFLQPLMESFGYRIVTSPNLTTTSSGVNVPGFALVTSQFAGNNLGYFQVSEGRDLYSLDTGQSREDTFTDGTPMYADAVIIRYTWTDALGQERTAIDAYAPAGYVKPYYLELDQPYPGAGRAQSLYNRMVARRRSYQATFRFRVLAEPSAQISITSSRIGGSVVGQIDTIEHDLVAGTSTVTTKNTVAYPTSAWQRLPAGESWNASPAGSSWTAETIS